MLNRQRRRGDSLNYVRDEAVRESLAQMVGPWESIEELDERFAGVTDEAQLKIFNGFSGLGKTFIQKLEKLGLKAVVPGECRLPSTVVACPQFSRAQA